MQTERPTEMLAGRYALRDELGRSGTGVSFRAFDTVLERTVAVKVLRPELADDPAFVARLAETTSAVARLSEPGLVHLLDTGGERGVSFLVREHVGGESLRARLRRVERLPAAETARLGVEILEALGAAHASGLLHLDVKPENVLLGPDGHARLADLGLGQAVRAIRPGDAGDLLSPTPGPPELNLGGPADARTDVYLVGALLFEALTGTAPAGEASPRAQHPGIPEALDAAVARALEPDPAARFADAAAFAEAVRGASAGLEDAISLDPRHGHTLRGWLLVPALVLVVAALAIAAGLWLGRLEIGGPLGVRAADDDVPGRPTEDVEPSTSPLPVAAVSTFDPFGDGTENDSTAPNAIDGEDATAWRSENYFDGDLRKPGIGLVLDLGQARTVTGFRLTTPHPGWSFGLAVGDDPEALAATIDTPFMAEGSMRVEIPPSAGRYVLLWIVSVVDAGDGNRAEVAELEVVGPDA